MKITNIVTVYLLIAFVSAKVSDFRLQKIECTRYDSSVGNITCFLHNQDTAQSEVDVDFYISRPVDGILIHMEIWKKLNGNFILTPINITINACHYFDKKERVPFHASLIMKWVQSVSNINHKCPYIGHVFIKNLNTENFRKIIPVGDYRLDVKLFEKFFTHPLVLIRGFGKKC
ncbi:uncharacterized protein LOC119652013 [Hermetia illucens]|uniref:uncharacterized protein LOC119652013 n=1 Tax=Hermetia illucens TaxID=343691 RepID=UPI0018CC1D9D|nr:uncharacterized protein LOC119652013 [Hermetia illucens]